MSNSTISPDIHIVDDLNPEDTAMLQALYSRSPASVTTHLDKVSNRGSANFMEKYYVGYGHASIGDCGVTSIFIEQVSQLTAKAIQDNPLYSGQEASTRYIDFSTQGMVDPYNDPESGAIQSKWMEIYNRLLDPVKTALFDRHPFDDDEYPNERVWKNTINARAFDILRSLLPLGSKTLLSWTTNLRQARDHLMRLKHHPLAEVRETAHDIFDALISAHPNSFAGDEMDNGVERYQKRDQFQRQYADSAHYISPTDLINRFDLDDQAIQDIQSGAMIVDRSTIDLDSLRQFEGDLLKNRPKGASLPWRLESYGRYNCLFMLDFGSFRDLQRHRNGVCQIPRVTGRFGMHPWYMRQLDELLDRDDFARLEADLNDQFNRIDRLTARDDLDTNALDHQYLYPMGMSCLCQVSYSLPQMIYVGELRSSKHVHASLRPVAQDLLRVLEEDIDNIALYGDMEAEDWTAKRGEQTIIKKAG
jgi:thymidylate synthase ThyX